MIVLKAWHEFPLAQFARNQPRAVGAVLKKKSSSEPTFRSPDCEGCVPSDSKSARTQVRQSKRGVVPFAQRYGPHAIQGAPVSEFKSPARGSTTIPPFRIWEIGRASC